jgi:hypothetical protein
MIICFEIAGLDAVGNFWSVTHNDSPHVMLSNNGVPGFSICQEKND